MIIISIVNIDSSVSLPSNGDNHWAAIISFASCPYRWFSSRLLVSRHYFHYRNNNNYYYHPYSPYCIILRMIIVTIAAATNSGIFGLSMP